MQIESVFAPAVKRQPPSSTDICATPAMTPPKPISSRLPSAAWSRPV